MKNRFVQPLAAGFTSVLLTAGCTANGGVESGNAEPQSGMTRLEYFLGGHAARNIIFIEGACPEGDRELPEGFAAYAPVIPQSEDYFPVVVIGDPNFVNYAYKNYQPTNDFIGDGDEATEGIQVYEAHGIEQALCGPSIGSNYDLYVQGVLGKNAVLFSPEPDCGMSYEQLEKWSVCLGAPTIVDTQS